MRMRATRASATGCNSRRRTINPAKLFQVAGRTGVCYTSDNGGVSWDDLIAENLRQIAAGTPALAPLTHGSDGSAPVVYPIGAGQGLGRLLDRSGGNYHLTQPSAAARGEFSRRYNQLTNSHRLENDSWVKGSAGVGLAPTVSVSSDLGPSGQVARAVTFNCVDSSSSTHRSFLSSSPQPGGVSASGVLMRCVVRLKAASAGDIGKTLRLSMVPSSGVTVIVLSGVWQEITHSVTTLTGAAVSAILESRSNQSGPVTALVDGLDIRPSADSNIGSAYQRVTSSSDYDEVGYPTYLRQQTDDCAKAMSVNPNGATKALLVWAGQKMSDAAVASLIQTSADSATNAGALSLYGPPVAASAAYRSRSRGTASSDVATTGHSAGSRHVVRVATDITNDSNALFVNSTLVVSGASDQGAGTYQNYDVFVGSTNGTSEFANTRTYAPPLLMYCQPADPGPSASDIARLESKYKAAAGVVS